MKKFLNKLTVVGVVLFIIGAMFPVLWKVTAPVSFTIFFVWAIVQIKDDVKEIFSDIF